MKKSPLNRRSKRPHKKKEKRPNDKYYRNKADELFMSQFRNKPCEICGTTYRTAGHHIVPKSRSKALRYIITNIIVLCPTHHTYGNELAPHSKNQLAVDRFNQWMKDNKPGQWAWVKEYEHQKSDFTYKQALEQCRKELEDG